MRLLFVGSSAAAAVALAVSISSTGAASDPKSSRVAAASASAADTTSDAITPQQAARFAKQSSFGPTLELIDTIVAKKSASAWIDDQFTRTTSTYSDIALKAVPGNFCSGLTGADASLCGVRNFTVVPVQMRFYANAVNNDDQLRQRIAFALSQIIVASDIDVHNTAGLATFEQILLSGAFGNYREILKNVTLNGFMGDYLDTADSDKVQPNENYARELMQLFSIGTVSLNSDGSVQKDGSGAPIPSYTNSDVKEIARALTGWHWPAIPGGTDRDLTRPMIKNAARFDSGAKTFLGKTISATATQEANVDTVIDAVFNHPNTAPFVSRRLIQQLTVADPSPDYVKRVAAAFADNGLGVRGDMKAIIRAIYLDPEARNNAQLPGKVKEPVLLATSLARAIGLNTDGYAFFYRDGLMGQTPFRAPSVFNFYPSDFPLPRGEGIISPVSKLVTTSTIVNRHDFIWDWTIGADPTHADFKPVMSSLGTLPNWASWEANGIDDSKTIDRINLVMLNGTMTSAQRQSLLNAMAQIKNTDPAAQARKRAQTALYVVASSPLFQVDR